MAGTPSLLFTFTDPNLFYHSLSLGNVYRYYLPVAATILWMYITKGHRKALPPSPGPELPIIGHLHLLPWSNIFLKLTSWSRELGPIYRINLGGTNTVVLGSHKVAADLLDRRSAKYSERPSMIVAGDLMCGGMNIAMTDANDTWRRMRRAAHEAMKFNSAVKYHGLQEAEACILSYHLLQKPADWDDHLQRTSNSSMLSIIYGLPPRLNSLDPDIRRSNSFVSKVLAAAAPGAFFVEYFPWMMHLPRLMCPWRQYAERLFESESAYFESLFDEVEIRMRQGTANPCVATSLIEEREKSGMSRREAAWISFSLYAAGGETTATQMSWLLVALASNPTSQKKAQAEVDRVVGRDRMPTFNDIPQLSYLSALITEVMRWRGVGPLGIPHRLKTDDYYEGFYLPKDTVVIANAWGMNHDPEVWGPDADEFKPERHLEEDGRLKKPLPDTHGDSHLTYGTGRRICVGKAVAQNAMLIQTACLLWTANISLPKDSKSGKPIVLDPFAWIEHGLFCRPEPISLQISPRSSDTQNIILRTMDAKGIEM